MGPALVLIPLVLAGLGLVAAGAKKKQTVPVPPRTDSPLGTKPAAQLPADVVAMVSNAVASGNPETQRRVAAALQSRYPEQAAFLNDNAATLDSALQPYGAQTLAQAQVAEAQQAAVEATAAGASPAQAVQAAKVAATTAAPPAVIVPAPAIETAPPSGLQAVAAAAAAPVAAVSAAQTAATNALAAGATPAQAVQAAQTAVAQTVATPSSAGVPRPEPIAPMPAVAPSVPDTSGKMLAAEMAKQLSNSKVKKGTATEPRAVVQAFQTQERLSQNDGSYGFETAMALADRYGIVPPKPLYWGKKGGPANLPAQQKQTYSAHLTVLASQDPARADEWRAAAKV